jgi:hypothetical protein
MTTEQLKHELAIWHSRAQAHAENYKQMLKHVDAITSEYRSFALAVRLSFEHGAFTESTQRQFEQWLRDNAPSITRSGPDACPECGTFEEPYFCRLEPMGYFCPDCGTEAR